MRRPSIRTGSRSMPLHDDVVGQVQVTVTSKHDTLPDIARRFNVGYEEIVRANPGVDVVAAGRGTRDRGAHAVRPAQRAARGHRHQRGGHARFSTSRRRRRARSRWSIRIRSASARWAGPRPEGATKVVSKQKDPVWSPAGLGASRAQGQWGNPAGGCACRTGQSAGTIQVHAGLAQLPDPWHQQALWRGPALQPWLHPPVSGRRRETVWHDRPRHAR